MSKRKMSSDSGGQPPDPPKNIQEFVANRVIKHLDDHRSKEVDNVVWKIADNILWKLVDTFFCQNCFHIVDCSGMRIDPGGVCDKCNYFACENCIGWVLCDTCEEIGWCVECAPGDVNTWNHTCERCLKLE